MGKLSGKDIMIRGSILGAIAMAPSITTLLVLWAITGDMIVSAIAGAVVHFVAMAFSVKFAKRFLVKRDDK